MGIERLASTGFVPATICDLGCGTAILAMANARFWPARIIATDHDENAIATAAAMLTANGLADRITLDVAAGFDHPFHQHNRLHDLVLASLLHNRQPPCSPGPQDRSPAGMRRGESVLDEWSPLLMRQG